MRKHAPVRIPLVMNEDSYERLAHCQRSTGFARTHLFNVSMNPGALALSGINRP